MGLAPQDFSEQEAVGSGVLGGPGPSSRHRVPAACGLSWARGWAPGEDAVAALRPLEPFLPPSLASGGRALASWACRFQSPGPTAPAFHPQLCREVPAGTGTCHSVAVGPEHR